MDDLIPRKTQKAKLGQETRGILEREDAVNDDTVTAEVTRGQDIDFIGTKEEDEVIAAGGEKTTVDTTTDIIVHRGQENAGMLFSDTF